MTRSSEWFDRARAVLPGGVNSPVRAFKAVGGTPPFVVSARGPMLADADGKTYIDYIGSWGPMILGHAHPDILDALELAVRGGSSFGTPCPVEVLLAEEIVARVPSLEMVRFVNSGTEATMSAVRLARAATGRDVVLKFDGAYHGHADCFLIQAGSGAATFGVPNSPGVTSGAARDTRVARFNDLEDVERQLKADEGRVAAVIVEPVAGNMGVVPPEPGFLKGLRALCDEHGALLIFDEVMTGFRVHHAGAEGLYGVTPDLSTFGKVIGGGLPVGAYGGRRELMARISPEGSVYQAGTLSGNPLAMTAGLKTLQALTDEAYERLELASQRLEHGLNDAIGACECSATVQRVGSMLTLFFAKGPLRNMDDVKAADHGRFKMFFNGMLERGIHLPPSGYEAWFVSLSHDERAIDRTVEAAGEALALSSLRE